ncbi:MAG: aspartate--tRNA ligase [Armatimonadetes bacterium]|nr:aspartate--tRNA ligase [Armatimonadota bacterium]
MATLQAWQRTHWCGDVRKGDVGGEMTFNGWVRRRRDHGGLIFVDLADRTGLCQVVFDPSESAEAHEAAGGLRSEYVVSVSGVLVARSEETINPNLATGEVELRVRRLEVLNPSETPPFSLVEEDAAADELIRLRYRYLDLRTPRMQQNLRLRHRAAQAVRAYLDRQGFWEVETPILFRQTPEGARDYLVPSRVNPGHFYALPQSPQIMKQLLMVAGVERYYQLARCLRDEDLRRDRQPEHTQIDMEMAFVTREDILNVTEGLFRAIWRDTIGYELPDPFPRMTHAEAIDRYGTDKPDLRYGMELTDLSDLAAQCEFRVFTSAVQTGGQVKALVAPGGAQWGRMEMDRMTEELQRETRAKGLAWIAVLAEGPKSPIAKFFSEELMSTLLQRTGAQAGDMVLMVADRPDVVAEALDRLRRKLALRLNLIPEGAFAPLWVLDFPMFARNADEGRWDAEHHPFCMPHPDDIDLIESDPGKVRAQAYDVVVNGDELGSGSIRIHRRDIQQRIFSMLGITPEQAEERFGFLLKAFEYGTPPHGGIAPGFDRIVMWLCGEPNIREVMAFPKTQTAQCLMSGAPSMVDERLLRDLHVRVDLPPQE